MEDTEMRQSLSSYLIRRNKERKCEFYSGIASLIAGAVVGFPFAIVPPNLLFVHRSSFITRSFMRVFSVSLIALPVGYGVFHASRYACTSLLNSVDDLQAVELQNLDGDYKGKIME
eukprot:TRINITY_DN6510_c0_g1_i1.p1 TRINITY_DN6510_c0_g1~~TRINITY_DN6510_c0_g1_i1.p1  ORF type:complete len:132 (+),score=17.96 TRINITY_DN6510_c0_g1_i1:51-398(+)